MNTAVQLRLPSADGLRGELIYGTPCAVIAGKLGPVALFASGVLLAYRMGHRRRTRLFVFRTLEVEARCAARIPGVRPRVQLLFDLHTVARVRLIRGLFAYLTKTGWNPASLPDGFYLRVGVALAGRLPQHKILLSLLAPHAPAVAGFSEALNSPGPSGGHREFCHRLEDTRDEGPTPARRSPGIRQPRDGLRRLGHHTPKVS